MRRRDQVDDKKFFPISYIFVDWNAGFIKSSMRLNFVRVYAIQSLRSLNWKYFTIYSNLKKIIFIWRMHEISNIFMYFFSSKLLEKLHFFSIVYSVSMGNAFPIVHIVSFIYIFAIIYSNYNRRKCVRAITYFKMFIESKSMSKSHFYLSIRAQFSLFIFIERLEKSILR